MIKNILLKLGWSKEEIRDAKVICYIDIGFIIFAFFGIIPWVYGWYKILIS